MLFMWLNLIFRSLEHCHPTTKTDFVLFFSFHIKSHTEVPDNWFLTKSVFKSITLWLSCFSVFRRYSLRDNFDCHIVFTDSVHGFRIYHWKVPFRTIIANANFSQISTGHPHVTSLAKEIATQEYFPFQQEITETVEYKVIPIPKGTLESIRDVICL